MSYIKILAFFLLFISPFVVTQVSGANVFVPKMELTSNLNLHGEITTRGDFQISFDGGYKYQGKLMFQYLNNNLENNTTPALIFDGAQATVKNALNLFDITYWTGYYGVVGEGKHYKGYLYHRRGGFDYEGYLPILGTGLVFSRLNYERSRGQFFIYQRYGSSTIDSIDLNLGIQRGALQLNLLSGISGENFRLGTQIIYTGENTDLYLTIGNPTIRKDQSSTYDDLYFLLEEWFKMGNWNLILSIFSRPDEHYNYLTRSYVSTGEINDIDFNFDLNYEPETSYVAGGGELNIQTNRYESFGISLSPYIRIYSSGIIWKVKVDFNLLSEWKDFITAYLNINASF
ncbi:MAG: hypothetical protein ACUVWJ_05615 [Spirochaetota bacterium]